MANTQKRKKRKRRKSLFLYKITKKREMEIFAFCVITFDPITIKTCLAPQNDRQNLSFVKDEHIYG